MCEILVDLKQANQDMLYWINFNEFVGFFLSYGGWKFHYKKGVNFQQKNNLFKKMKSMMCKTKNNLCTMDFFFSYPYFILYCPDCFFLNVIQCIYKTDTTHNLAYAWK